MRISVVRFNIILTACALVLSGCKTSDAEKAEKKEATFLRFHLETTRTGTPRTMRVPVYRANPMLVTVERDALLDEGFMTKAEVVDADAHGGYAIKISFDEMGTRRLQAASIENKGLRLAVSAHWTESRWLGAPLITKNLNDGIFIFTPDATREESERIVAGLKNVIKKLKKPYTF
jgi:hypothetical protein